MLTAGTRQAERELGRGEEPWWLVAPGLLEQVEHRASEPSASACYQIGDAFLRVGVDDRALLAAFQQLYGDCAVSAPLAPDGPVVRCAVRRSVQPPLVVLTFQEGRPADPAAAAYSLLRSTRAVPPYRVYDSPLPHWRLAGGANGPLLAACDAHVLVDPRQVPPDFVVEYLVGITLATQPGMLPIHGASLRVGDAGMVLVGASHSGKTTISLHLAARGHTLLGDEVALIRLATNEVVPFRRTVNLRPGPHGRELATVLGLGGEDEGEGPPLSARWTGPRRIGELFPARPAHPARLRAVFFLGGFADRPSLEPFRLTLDQADVFSWLATPEIAYCSWGLAPVRRAFRLLVLRQVLGRIPCWLLRVGPPGDTIGLIERTMEELRC